MSERTLLFVAVNTDQPDIERRMKAILAGATPIEVVGPAEVWAKELGNLTHADVTALRNLIGGESVERLNLHAGFRDPLSSNPDEED